VLSESLEPLSASPSRTPSRCADLVCGRPPSNVCGRPQIAPSPAANRRREVWIMAELVGTLFGDAEELGNVDDSKELPPRHSPQYP
jgi:hypothetical protein